MTPMDPHHLRLTAWDGPGAVHVELSGDLDHDSADRLLDLVTERLADPAVRDLHLDCARLGTIDSLGLSILIMVRRCTAAGGVRLHLDGRTAGLNRLLETTGTLVHLTADAPGTTVGADADVAQVSVARTDPAHQGHARATGPDSTA